MEIQAMESSRLSNTADHSILDDLKGTAATICQFLLKPDTILMLTRLLNELKDRNWSVWDRVSSATHSHRIEVLLKEIDNISGRVSEKSDYEFLEAKKNYDYLSALLVFIKKEKESEKDFNASSLGWQILVELIKKSHAGVDKNVEGLDDKIIMTSIRRLFTQAADEAIARGPAKVEYIPKEKKETLSDEKKNDEKQEKIRSLGRGIFSSCNPELFGELKARIEERKKVVDEKIDDEKKKSPSLPSQHAQVVRRLPQIAEVSLAGISDNKDEVKKKLTAFFQSRVPASQPSEPQEKEKKEKKSPASSSPTV